jgi:hypothetical protein
VLVGTHTVNLRKEYRCRQVGPFQVRQNFVQRIGLMNEQERLTPGLGELAQTGPFTRRALRGERQRRDQQGAQIVFQYYVLEVTM